MICGKAITYFCDWGERFCSIKQYALNENSKKEENYWSVKIKYSFTAAWQKYPRLKKPDLGKTFLLAELQEPPLNCCSNDSTPGLAPSQPPHH